MFVKNALYSTGWPRGSTQDITPFTLRDGGQNGPPPLLTRSGATEVARGSLGTQVILELADFCCIKQKSLL
jgi:hypothetical protein